MALDLGDGFRVALRLGNDFPYATLRDSANIGAKKDNVLRFLPFPCQNEAQRVPRGLYGGNVLRDEVAVSITCSLQSRPPASFVTITH